ncbi:MAG TPA: Rieske 2Fe-2S domain-containing protein [Gaiellaceae bacterium]|nr:Rieske 2Fe-2S domain-containing protein [Gaiellaceae bacterium]
MDPHGGHGTPHEPTPTIWPVGFAIGIACIFIGLILSPIVVAVGAVLAAIFGFLWIRDVTKGIRTVTEPAAEEPEPAPAPIPAGTRPAGPEPGEGEVIRYPRSKFLEAATLGLGGLIGVVVTAPVLGFTILPPFVKQGHPKVDVGAIEDFPENQYVIATYLLRPEEGEVSRRTAYIRNNGLLDDVPSFTILSNRCVHLGCPVQVNGLPIDEDAQTQVSEGQRVTRIPTAAAAGFGCPCHGGQYDNEGNRTAGPPVRALDRYEFEINNGRLLLGDTYSVSEVDGTGAEAQIHAYPLSGPGQHVDGPEGLLYPVQPPR